MDDAPALLLLHGFTGSGASWQPVLSGLQTPYRAVAPDIRGHASAAARRPVTLAAVLEDLDAELGAAGIGPDAPLTLVGYSQGGRIALHAALRFGPRLERLILIGASPGIQDPSERARRREADERLADEFEQMTIEQIADRWAKTPILGGITPEQAQNARAERLRSTPAGLAEALRGLGAGALPPLWDRLERITAPVQLVVGERDHKFRQVAAEMRMVLAEAEIHCIPGAGHAVQLEQPGTVTQLIQGDSGRLA